MHVKHCWGLLLTLACVACQTAPPANSAPPINPEHAVCGPGTAALRQLVREEYAFAVSARTSLRTAFLQNLSADSIVFSPGPVPGRATYEATPESKDQIDWHPILAQIANSADLGFTTGPFVHRSAADGVTVQGDYITVWRRDEVCHWQVVFDAGVRYGAAAVKSPKLDPAQLESYELTAPRQAGAAADFARRSAEFARVATVQGASVALRAGGASNVRLYTDGNETIEGLGAVVEQLSAHPLVGTWHELGGQNAKDWTLAYRYGEIRAAEGKASHAYFALWQANPKQAGWGLRLLMISQMR
jgi:hypothetical protein